jgi:hypothetical protein
MDREARQGSVGGTTTGARRRNDDSCKDEHVDDQLPTNVVAAIARAIELLNRVMAEEGRTEQERLDLSSAVLDLISAIDPEAVREMIEPGIPGAVAALIEIDPTAWSAQVDALTDEQRKRLMELLARHGDDIPDE